jgi:hypothetical protein
VIGKGHLNAFGVHALVKRSPVLKQAALWHGLVPPCIFLYQKMGGDARIFYRENTFIISLPQRADNYTHLTPLWWF